MFIIFTILFSSPLQALSSVIDIFEETNGHEPRVAINCGKVPFHIDLDTGAWVKDDTADSVCDQGNKDVVKSYCQKLYPKLNVTNIVEANDPVLFNNWCEPFPNENDCSTVKQAVPYRCLVHEYEADALMVPNGCTFDHLHDENLCLSHHDWKLQASDKCELTDMKLKDYGILLSCGTDVFSGVEFVCCPKVDESNLKENVEDLEEKDIDYVDYVAFSKAIKNFQKDMPPHTEGCDRDNFYLKEMAMEDRHRNRIAVVVDEWDEAENRYNLLKAKDPIAAEEKMKRTLEVFRETLAALEEESKEEQHRLRLEKADCINTDIQKQKRNAMIDYIVTIEEKPANATKILSAVQKFIQTCEHDRVHSLRHFEHVRNRNDTKAIAMRPSLLKHLKDLNTVVNNTMALLNYLPKIAQQFGLNDVGMMLKPRLVMPDIAPVKELHDHDEIPDQLKPADQILTSATQLQTNEVVDEEMEKSPTLKEVHLKKAGSTQPPSDELPGEEKPATEQLPVTEESQDINLTELRPKSPIPVTSDAVTPDERGYNKIMPLMKELDEELDFTDTHEIQDEWVQHKEHPHHNKRSAGFAAVIGLSCGALVIMLGILVALIARRKRINHRHVMIPTNDNEDQEHLVHMQKKGFENPTYKFYYY